MILHCTICDDNPVAAQRAGDVTAQVLKDKNIMADISVYTDSRQLMFELDPGRRIELMILDIEMPGVSGLEIAEYVKNTNPNCRIIFLTSYMNYAVDGYADLFLNRTVRQGSGRLLPMRQMSLTLRAKSHILLNGTICAECCRVNIFFI